MQSHIFSETNSDEYFWGCTQLLSKLILLEKEEVAIQVAGVIPAGPAHKPEGGEHGIFEALNI